MEEVIQTVQKNDWITHNFNSESSSDAYNPCNYIRSIEEGEGKYQLILDLNIFQYIINAVKKEKKNQSYKDAIALVIFCQKSGIEIDPSYVTYEKINHNPENADEAIKNLNLFHCINNTNPDDLISYITSPIGKISIEFQQYFNHEEMKRNLLKHKRLKEWDSLYLIVLYLTYVNQLKQKNKLEKLKMFINWSIKEFRLSLQGVVYASILFSEYPLKKMMKYKSTDSKKEKLSAVENMTWDFFIMKEYFKYWVEKDSVQEYMFATNDKAFKELLKNSIEIQKTSSFLPIKSKLNSSCYIFLENFLKQRNDKIERVYRTEKWDTSYRVELIKKYEALIINEDEFNNT